MLDLFFYVTALMYGVEAAVRDKTLPLGGPGNVVFINSAQDFCIFLPPKPNMTIAESEGYPRAEPAEAAKWAVAYCTQKTTQTPGSQLLYDDFITGLEFHQNNTHISVSGTIDAKKAGLIMDGGGYYDLDDNVNSPPGGICQGYASFFNNINPIDGLFALQCCKEITGCRIDLVEVPTIGMRGLVPGSYKPGFPNGPLPKTGRTLNGFSSPSNQSGNPITQQVGSNNGSTSKPSTNHATGVVGGNLFFLSLLMFMF